MAGGFLDDVGEGPADCAGVVAEGLVVGGEGGDGGFGEGPFGAVGGEDGAGGVCGGDAPVVVGVFCPQGGQVRAARDAGEPVAFDGGEVLDDAEDAEQG